MTVTAGIYRHYKGNLYQVFFTARHSETEQVHVVYKALYGEHGMWIRPLEMFEGTVVVDGKVLPRFQWTGQKAPLSE